jgi:hypothetical protein
LRRNEAYISKEVGSSFAIFISCQRIDPATGDRSIGRLASRSAAIETHRRVKKKP